MHLRRRQHTVILGGLSLFLGLILIGCGREETPQQTTTQQNTHPMGAVKALRALVLPSMEGFEDPVRTQMQDQYTLVQALSKGVPPDTAALGEAYGILGQLMLAYDLNDAAEPTLLNTAILLPDDARWPYYLGYLYQQRAQPASAAPWYEHALALQPDDVPTHLHLAEVYRDLDRQEEALDLLDKVIVLDPKCAPAYFLLGQMTDEPAQAITYYEKVLLLQPNASIAHYPLGQAYRDQGNPERSRYHLDRRGNTPAQVEDNRLRDLERLKEGAQAKMYLARRLMKQRRYQEAVSTLTEVVTENPDEADAHLTLGAAYGQLGNMEKAMEAVQEAVRLDPSESKAHYNLGILYLTEGDVDKALSHFRTAAEIKADYKEAHLAITRILWRHQQCREALPHFKTFLAASPEDVEARINQAICHAELGEYVEAWTLLEAGLDAFPQHPGIQDALIRVLSASKDATVRDGRRALELAQALTTAYPRTETLESLAMAYAELGRFTEAVQAQNLAIQAAGKQGLRRWLEHLDANRRRYEQGQPCRTPWETVIFEK